MTTFNVIDSPEALPIVGTRESPTLDFKGVLDRIEANGKPDYFEMAKDIAAMASAYGGTLLFRALGKSQLARYERLTEAEANEACEAYQTAAKDRCIPVPPVTPVKIPFDGGFVVAVNIFAILDRPVAVKVKDAVAERFGPDAYVFPVRLSTHAIPYSPENLPMLLNPVIRRTIILLEAIPTSGREKVTFTWHSWTDDRWRPQMGTIELRIAGVDVNGNALRAQQGPPDRTFELRLPLDDVDTVWEVRPGEWSVRVSGAFDTTSGLRYVTRPK